MVGTEDGTVKPERPPRVFGVPMRWRERRHEYTVDGEWYLKLGPFQFTCRGRWESLERMAWTASVSYPGFGWDEREGATAQAAVRQLTTDLRGQLVAWIRFARELERIGKLPKAAGRELGVRR